MNIKKIVYVAGVVQDNSKLMELPLDVDFPNKYCHHMTIQFGNLDVLPNFIGKEIQININMMWGDTKACAVTGIVSDEEIRQLMKSNHQLPHITIATAADVKPVYSNDLIRNGFGWEIQPFDVTMKIGAFVVFDDDSTGWVFNR